MGVVKVREPAERNQENFNGCPAPPVDVEASNLMKSQRATLLAPATLALTGTTISIGRGLVSESADSARVVPEGAFVRVGAAFPV